MNKNKKTQLKRGLFEAWVHKKINEILGGLVLDTLSYQAEFIYEDKVGEKKESGSHAMFSIRSVARYRQAVIFAQPHAFKLFCDGQYHTLIDALIHELAHIHTTPLFTLAQDRYTTQKQLVDQTEELTELLAVYIRRLIAATNNKVYN